MKRILIVRSNPIEPDSRVEKEANSLAKFGHRITLFGWDRAENHSIKKDLKKLSDTEVERITLGAKAGFGAGFKSLFPFLRFQVGLFFWLIKNAKQFDLFHFCDFDTAFTGSCACRLLRRKYVFDIFDYLSTDANSFFKKIIKRMEDSIINHAHATIICTEKRRNQIATTKPCNLTVIHNSPPNYEANQETGPLDPKIKIAYVGVLLEHRLLPELLKVVSEMPNEVELHIGGFGQYDELVKKYAEEYSNIIYYGKLAYDATIRLEEKCDIITAIYAPYIGNHFYAAPNKFYEALMLGKPVIMVKDTGMSEYVEQYNLGTLIEYTEDGLRAGIKDLASRRNQWNEISNRARSLYKTEFSWDEMERRLLDLYEKL